VVQKGIEKKKLLRLCTVQRIMARQKSRLTWLSEGDANTSYFHTHASHRRRQNFIGSLKVRQHMFTEHEEIEKALTDHYISRFGTPANQNNKA
jgi:hypothetical protein